MLDENNPFNGLDGNPSAGKNPFEGKDLSIDKNPTSKNPIKVEAMRSPLVILYGPREVGKTMVLLRTVQYLKKIGYTVNLDEGFRSDAAYKTIIKQFDYFLADPRIAERTKLNESLLLNVTFQGEFQFQILEDSGEHFFDPNKYAAPTDNQFQEENIDLLNYYPAHLVKLFKENKQKLFVFFFHKDMMSSANMRENYAAKINAVLNKYVMAGRDSTIFLYNKIDKLPVFDGGRVRIDQVHNYFQSDSYTALMAATADKKNRFVPFSAGEFVDGQYLPSDDVYPKALVEVIQESIKGKSNKGFMLALLAAGVAIIVILILLLQ